MGGCTVGGGDGTSGSEGGEGTRGVNGGALLLGGEGLGED